MNYKSSFEDEHCLLTRFTNLRNNYKSYIHTEYCGEPSPMAVFTVSIFRRYQTPLNVFIDWWEMCQDCIFILFNMFFLAVNNANLIYKSTHTELLTQISFSIIIKISDRGDRVNRLLKRLCSLVKLLTVNI